MFLWEEWFLRRQRETGVNSRGIEEKKKLIQSENLSPEVPNSAVYKELDINGSNSEV